MSYGAVSKLKIVSWHKHQTSKEHHEATVTFETKP